MPAPKLCLIFEAIDDTSGIAKVAKLDVLTALGAGYRVTVVAKYLDESLRGRVEWLPLYVPPKLFLLKWATARHFMKSAIGPREFDIVHAHQPQAAAMSDVFTCHFLTRVAQERNCLERRRTPRARLVRWQQLAVLKLEDRCYRRWNPATRMVFCSELLRDEFTRLYGPPPRQTVIDNACPPIKYPSPEVHAAARAKLVGDVSTPIVGYLGGVDERKGFGRLIEAARGTPGLFFLLAGPHTEGLSLPELAGRVKTLGITRDLDSFYAACDAVVVPSLFDPSPMVVLEAVSRGVPVVATAGVGNLKHLLRTGAGAEWRPENALGDVVASLLANPARAGASRMADELSEDRRAARLLSVYEEVLSQPLPTARAVG